MSPSEKRRFLQQNPREQLITKTDLAKYENVWRDMPHIVSLGAQKNFRNFAEYIDELWKLSDADFNEEYFRNIVAMMIIWKYTERMVSRQSWYQGGYRANIVAYTIAKLSQLIKTEHKDKVLDFRSVWNQQHISQALEQQLEMTSAGVFKMIVTEDRPIDNVTEWCKKKLCWEKVEKMEITLLPKLKVELLNKGEFLSAKKDAKKLQKTDDGIAAQTEVINKGSRYWQLLLNWAEKKNLLTPDEKKLVGIAVQIPSKIPTDFQSVRLLEICTKIKIEGFDVKNGRTQ
jgi:hypothetical protein